MTRVEYSPSWSVLLGPSAERLQMQVQQQLRGSNVASGSNPWAAFLQDTAPDRLFAPFSTTGMREGIAPGGTIPPWDRYFPKPVDPGLTSEITVTLMEKLDALLTAVTRIGELLSRVFGVAVEDGIPQAPPSPEGVPATGAPSNQRTPSTGAGAPTAAPGKTPTDPPSPRNDHRSGRSDDLGETLLTRLGDRMHNLETQLNTIDPSTPQGQIQLMRLQNEMQRVTQMITLISEIWKARHDATMGVIRNMR